jgi:hypothetical protein
LGVAKTLPDRIAATAAQLAQLQARQRLHEQADKARARKHEKREQARTLAELLRSQDAHRKIELGGVVIAAGADGIDPAELCGWLLTVLGQRTAKPDAGRAMRERGLRHFAEREARRATSRPGRQI